MQGLNNDTLSTFVFVSKSRQVFDFEKGSRY